MTDTKKSWFSTGYDGIDEEKERIARGQGPNRYWMKEGSKRSICLIDDDPFCVYEHSPKINGSFRNQFTCLKDVNDIIPCCEKLGEKSRYYVGYYTIVDLTENVDTKGKKYQYEIKLLPAKLKTLQLLRLKKQDRGSLIGCIFTVHRVTSDDPNCGNVYDFEKEAKLDKLLSVANYKGKKLTDLYKEATEKAEVMQRLKDTFQVSIGKDGLVTPQIYSFNYASVLAPKTPAEVRSMLGAATVEPSGPDGETEAKDDPVPF